MGWLRRCLRAALAGGTLVGCTSLAGISGFYVASGDAAAGDADAGADAAGPGADAVGPGTDAGIAWIESAFGSNSSPDGGTVTSVTVTLQNRPPAGAVLVAVVYVDNYGIGSNATVTASGWQDMTHLYDPRSDYLTSWMYRVADGTETAVTFAAATWAPSRLLSAAIVAYAGASTTSLPIANPQATTVCGGDPWDGSLGCTSGAPAQPAPSGSVALLMLSLDSALSSSTYDWSTPTGMTARVNQGGLAVFDEPANGMVGPISTSHADTGSTGSAGLFVLERP
jgi:hypothetical protein